MCGMAVRLRSLAEVACDGESGMGWVEVVENPAGIVRLPWFAGLLSGVELVQVHQQVDQLAADGRGLEQGGQLGQMDEPPRIPARPVVVGSVDDAKDTMMGLAGLAQKLANLFLRTRHLVPPATALVLAARRDLQGLAVPGLAQRSASVWMPSNEERTAASHA